MADYLTVVASRFIRGAGLIRSGRPRQPGLPLLGLFSIGVAALLLLPILYLLVRFLQGDASTWSQVLSSRTLATLGRTLLLAGVVTVVSAILGILLGWMTVRTDLPFRRLWAVLFTLPLVIPSYVGAYLMVASLGPRGILAQWLETGFGIPQLPPIYGFPGAVYVLTLLSFPYTLLSVRAALQGMDPALEEAGRLLGHGPWQTFWRVTLPLLRPAIGSGSLLVALYVLRDFGAVAIMRYNTFTRVIYVQYQASFDRSAAAGLALVLVLVTMVILSLEFKTRRRGRYARNASSGDRPAAPVKLGFWRWPALILAAGVVTLSLLVPLTVLLYWLLRGLQAGEQLQTLWAAIQGSVLGSALAAAVTLAAALPVAVLHVRYPGWLGNLLERFSYAAFALPGIVVALALVFLGANYTPWMYQTLPMLVLAYLILGLPQAVGAVRTSLLQVPPSLEEAARTLGRGPVRAFRRVTLPLVQPGILAGTGLVFLTTMKELPATLILSPFGFKTLATGVWSAVSEAFFAQAAAPALVLVLVSSVPMAIIILRERHV